MPSSIFDETMQLLTKAVEGAQTRHKVISSNVTNADTPGYKALDLNFQKELKKALEETDESDTAQVQKIEWTEHKLAPAQNAEPRVDGNTVDLGKQLVEMDKNIVTHNSFIRALNTKIGILKTAISEKV